MLLRVKLVAYPVSGVRADTVGPLFQACRCPLVMLAVCLGHVRRIGCHAGMVFSRMRADQPCLEVDLHHLVACVQLQLLAHVLVGYRVVMLLILHVVVDVDLHHLKDLCLLALAGSSIEIAHRRSGIVDENLLASLVQLAHRTLLQASPACIAVTVLRVAVATGWVLTGVFLPQQLLGHALAFELLVNSGPVGQLEPACGAGIGARIEHGGKLGIVHLGWQGPTQPLGLGLLEQLLDGADTRSGAGAVLADGQAGVERRRSTSRIFRIAILLAGIELPEKSASVPK